jgi:hypothetical protein
LVVVVEVLGREPLTVLLEALVVEDVVTALALVVQRSKVTHLAEE